ncbi:transcriptional regulator [Escherichia coli]|uniref:Cox family DNA-binding protein n=1 Tax=Escherichia coli TaxID=562 RepID=UPI0017C3D272|nr:Cox family DNA-binding protein [Escherichia coli]EEZ1999926.1 transcriptional regulator [Escherichia coli]EEZ2511874.1 transcriptional regulator [Escherichia coli]EFA6039828.1 transcriptional regulator [Escherichia coli]EFL5589191.1 transcriptional regulator [Escherichia coli]EIZ6920045.1 transcriptional regulator [Escherichia coli]
MRDFIADKELSDTDHTTGAAYINADTSQQEATDNNDEQKPQRTYKKGATLRLDGPVAGLCSLEKGAAYIGLTKTALRAALQRNQMPGHKTRSNPEDENSDGVWWFNVREWDKLADELPECEPPEWHNWKSYWTYDRQKRKFTPADKEDCQTVNGKRVYKGRKSKLEQSQDVNERG